MWIDVATIAMIPFIVIRWLTIYWFKIELTT